MPAAKGGLRPVPVPPQACVPVIVCPECFGREPGAFVGERTGALVSYPRSHYTDKAGFLYCPHCGAVWNSLSTVPDEVPESDEAPRPTTGPADVSTFNPSNARPGDVGYYQRLWRTHTRNAGRFIGQAQRRMNDRISDGEACATILELPPSAKAAITEHIRILSERADLRELGHVKLATGRKRYLRSEAFTIATVVHVMERFHLSREDALSVLLATFPVIAPEEYTAAYHALAGWFGRNLWRDGPEDSSSGGNI